MSAAAPPPPRLRRPTRCGCSGWTRPGRVQFAELPRRQVLAGAGALARLRRCPWRPAGYRRADARGAAVLVRQLPQARHDDQPVASCSAPVIAHVHTLRTLAVDNSEPMRSELLLLAARAAEYAGWMSQEAGRDADALRWTDRAVTLAGGPDPHLASFALFRQAEIALYQHDPLTTDRARPARAAGPAAGSASSGSPPGARRRGTRSPATSAATRRRWTGRPTLLAIREHRRGPVLGLGARPRRDGAGAWLGAVRPRPARRRRRGARPAARRDPAVRTPGPGPVRGASRARARPARRHRPGLCRPPARYWPTWRRWTPRRSGSTCVS